MFTTYCEGNIEKIYQDKIKEIPESVKEDILIELHNLEEESQNEWQKEMVLLMKYLYATMPLSDIGNYSFEILKDFAGNGITLWKESPFVSEYDEEMFLSYVLYHRVNNEEIAPCRTLFRSRIQEYIQGKTARETALEVNYWCAAEATYQSTDDRTMSALAVFQSGSGRCGEESTFLVNALRSIGLPARQVYAPRWSHCDDNHAWVEVFIDGTWWFMGACEPEEELNRGWFVSASSRAMVINSKCFTKAIPNEEAIGHDGMVLMEGQTKRYAQVKLVHVFLKDEQGQPVAGAKLEFQVLNYAEFVTIASAVTDDKGHVSVSLGVGSIFVYAVAADKKAEYTLDTEKETDCTLILKNELITEKWINLDMSAPKDAPRYHVQLSEKQKEAGKIKLALATKKRQKKTEKLENPEIKRFLDTHNGDIYWRQKMLESLSQKDERDGKAFILEEHLQESKPFKATYEEKIFSSYIMCPRIQNEPLSLYRKYIKQYFNEKQLDTFRNNPAAIWEYICKNIEHKNHLEYSELITTPSACLRLNIGSEQSCKILFVAIARTIGIPARLNPMNGSPEYLEANEFESVLKKKEKKATLMICSGDSKIVWNYSNNWSLAKYEKGHYQSLQLGEFLWNEKGQVLFSMAPGQYRIITSNRLPNGNILAKICCFFLSEAEEKEITLHLRSAILEEMLEEIQLVPFYLRTKSDEKVSGEEIAGANKTLFMFLEESKEPTEHILNELMERQEEFIRCNNKIIFVLRSKEALTDPTLSKCLKTLPEIELYYDDFNDIIPTLGRSMYVDPDKLPLIMVTNRDFHGIYATSGYNVGTADLLLRILA